MYKFENTEQLKEWLASEVIGSREATEILECGRANLHKFVKNGSLVPILETANERLFLRSDVLHRKEQKYVRKPSGK